MSLAEIQGFLIPLGPNISSSLNWFGFSLNILFNTSIDKLWLQAFKFYFLIISWIFYPTCLQ